MSVAFNAPARPGSYAIFAGWQNSATCNGGITTDVEIGRVIVQP